MKRLGKSLGRSDIPTQYSGRPLPGCSPILFVLFTEDIGHLLLEGANDVGRHGCWPATPTFFEFSEDSIWGQRLDFF